MNVSLQTSLGSLLLMLDLWRRKQGEEVWVAERWRSTIRHMAYEIARAQGEFVVEELVANGACVSQMRKQGCFSRPMADVYLLPKSFKSASAVCGGIAGLYSCR